MLLRFLLHRRVPRQHRIQHDQSLLPVVRILPGREDPERAAFEGHFINLQLVGRNGTHHYNNQDHSMMTALIAARNIATDAGLDPWKVNTDAEYHEESKFHDEDKSGRLVPKRIPSLAET